jgi:hypothetical protein
MYYFPSRVPPPGTRLGPKGTRFDAQAMFLFVRAVFLLSKYTAREPCTVIGIPIKVIFSVHGSRAVYRMSNWNTCLRQSY